MFRSSNGMTLLSSHLIRDTCKSIYEGVFNITFNNRVLTTNPSIRGSPSLSTSHYHTNPNSSKIKKARRFDSKKEEKHFKKGFKDWCNEYRKKFSSDEDKHNMFEWFCDKYPNGRHRFPCRRHRGHVEHRIYENISLKDLIEQENGDTTDLPMDELDKFEVEYFSSYHSYRTDIEKDT
ncbi:hypothetical protein TSUD_398560 [Trifolium subterraneum]|uniref:Cathepsin propeptide inhibitor domain-containing protein n=1 Tax=Trifolium subterraneum TaxID=3900 RepID=A0A2Z6NG14_TRISU|nr:hypothetical protein TSUD_398560 [Trifolium subterraneum]